jgi:hypothetical protein
MYYIGLDVHKNFALRFSKRLGVMSATNRFNASEIRMPVAADLTDLRSI